MKYLIPIVVICTSVAASTAQAATCKASAEEKNLHGASLTSFMKKCTTDAEAICNGQATEKKLNGAARTSFTKKCVTDATGG